MKEWIKNLLDKTYIQIFSAYMGGSLIAGVIWGVYVCLSGVGQGLLPIIQSLGLAPYYGIYFLALPLLDVVAYVKRLVNEGHSHIGADAFVALAIPFVCFVLFFVVHKKVRRIATRIFLFGIILLIWIGCGLGIASTMG